MCLHVATYHFDILDQKNTRHIALLGSLKDLIIGNGGCTNFMHTFMMGMVLF